MKMRSLKGAAALCVASLLARARGFVVRPGVATPSYAREGPASRQPTPSNTAAGATSSTRLFAKATYKNFEDMLAKEPGALLVDFYATWCGPCKMMAETLAEVGPAMKDEIKIFKIDSDKYPSLMSKFAVNGLPTLILFKEGKELNRVEGVLPPKPLMQQVRYWLDGWETSNSDEVEQGNACSPPPQDVCKPPPQDACKPPPQDACKPPPRDACAPS